MMVEDMWRAIVEIRQLHTATHAILQEIRTMSETISQQVDASTAAIQSDIAALATAVGVVKAEIAALQVTVVPGSVVTQGQADALASLHASLSAQVAALTALEPAPVVAPAA